MNLSVRPTALTALVVLGGACISPSIQADAAAPCPNSPAITTPTTISAGDLTDDNTNVVVHGTTLTVIGHHTFCNLTVEAGGTVTQDAPDLAGLDLTITSNCTVDGTSAITVAARGYGGGFGPGSPGGNNGGYAGGAAYGGDGGDGANAPGSHASYGSLPQPSSLGSGGGFYAPSMSGGGAGGGAIHLVVSGTLHVDGALSADGGTGPTSLDGGGSGGSLWLEVGTLEGSGTISADGGAAPSGGGGGSGGRVAAYYTTNTFSGPLRALGGAGNQRGAAGTVFTKQGSNRATLSVINAGASPNAARTQLPTGTIAVAPDIVVSNGGLLAPAGAQTLYSLSILSGGNVTCTADPGSKIVLTIFTNCTVDGTSSMTVAGRGSAGGTGSGSPGGNNGGYAGGAAHGGDGGDGASAPGSHAVYGSVTQPTALGSGGGFYAPSMSGGGAGGGAIHLLIFGALHVDGALSADGGTGPTSLDGGGSGGSLWLEVGTLEGSGTISADGGAAPSGGGGGSGGRVAAYYTTNTFSGPLRALGGAGNQRGAAGTVFTKQGSNRATVTVVNTGAGPTAAPTLLATGPSAVPSDADIVVGSGAVMAPAGSQTFYSLAAVAGGIVTCTGDPGSTISMTVTTSCTVDGTSAITVAARGYGGGSGPGSPGGNNGSYAGGAAHGGDGGDGASAPGSHAVYGSVTQPTALGSGGGFYAPNLSGGGAGGGAIHLLIFGALHVDGALSADGGTGPTSLDGGGSGGSLWLEVGTLEGSGTISADGGAAPSGGGGGSGGRVAAYYTTNTFSGPLRALGGAGNQRGAAGTVFTKQGSNRATVTVVNTGAGPTAAPTLLATGPSAVPSDADIVVGSGAVMAPAGSQTFYSLAAVAGGIVTCTGDPGSTISMTVTTSCTVDGTSAITVATRGYGGGSGPGSPGGNNGGYAGGAAHGGDGGDGASAPGSHAVYGSVTQPTALGSGGGFYAPNLSGGGAGGGAIHLLVFGALHVDGALSADGGTGPTSLDGGGSGGSLWLEVGTLEGSGTISADGGAAPSAGGGGGGGRIAVYSKDCFTHFDVGTQLHANGGGGFAAGGGGTKFLGYESVAKAGIEDEFLAPSEAASPSTSLVAKLSPLTLVPFDVTPTGGAFAHTFTALPFQVAGARLALRVMAGAGAGVADDRVTVGFADNGGLHSVWSRYLGSTNGAGDPGLTGRPWTAGRDTTLVLDLAALPQMAGSPINAIPTINAHRFLDLQVQGNTAVDYALITCGTCSAIPADAPAPEPVAEALPKVLALDAFPNPFTPGSRVTFALPREAAVRVDVIDLAGRRVTTLFDGDAAAGTHQIGWNGSTRSGDAAGPGVYFLRMNAGGATLTRKVVFAR